MVMLYLNYIDNPAITSFLFLAPAYMTFLKIHHFLSPFMRY